MVCFLPFSKIKKRLKLQICQGAALFSRFRSSSFLRLETIRSYRESLRRVWLLELGDWSCWKYDCSMACFAGRIMLFMLSIASLSPCGPSDSCLAFVNLRSSRGESVIPCHEISSSVVCKESRSRHQRSYTENFCGLVCHSLYRLHINCRAPKIFKLLEHRSWLCVVKVCNLKDESGSWHQKWGKDGGLIDYSFANLAGVGNNGLKGRLQDEEAGPGTPTQGDLISRLAIESGSESGSMERHTSLRKDDRGPSIASLRSLERGDRSVSLAGSTRSASVRASDKVGELFYR